MDEKLYSALQIAEMLGMHPKTIQRYIREGRLKANKIGKEWRVTGHDLSVFTEGTDGIELYDTAPGLQAIIGAAMTEVRVSTVIDIPVKNSSEAAKVVNWITAALNSKSSQYGYTSMTSQLIEPEKIIRIMLWGSPSFMKVFMSSLCDLGTEQEVNNEREFG